MNTDITEVINIDPQILGGTPVFTGTRVPITHLLEYLQDGHDLDYFLDGFPSVKREQAVQLIEFAAEKLGKITEHEIAA